MMEYEGTGRTLEEAVQKALSELGIKKENAVIEVKEEPAQGLLGIIGTKEARVSVRALHEPAEYLQKYLEQLLSYMNVEGRVRVVEDEEKVDASVFGDDVGILIGRRGKTLGELQYLLNVIMRRQFSAARKMVVIDVENYRSKREKTLIQLARNVARKVSMEGYEQALEPMTPQERRIIHLALQEIPGIRTFSSGEEPYRKVIIAPR